MHVCFWGIAMLWSDFKFAVRGLIGFRLRRLSLWPWASGRTSPTIGETLTSWSGSRYGNGAKTVAYTDAACSVPARRTVPWIL